jgi:glucose/arabinose dehydrogenase
MTGETETGRQGGGERMSQRRGEPFAADLPPSPRPPRPRFSFKMANLSHKVNTMRSFTLFVSLLVVLARADAAILPGFRLERLAPAKGFVTSVAVDSSDRVYYTVTSGKVFRVDSGNSILIATVDTATDGNAALLGMAFRGPAEIVLHHVSPDLTADILATVNLETGETIRSVWVPCNLQGPCSSEHHGGNPIALQDGTILVGFGDFGGVQHAQQDSSAGGKIHRVFPDGTSHPYAKGFRNPYDLAWDPVSGKLIVSDNGASGNDEINLIGEGDNAGWSLTMGHEPAVEGTVPPIYVFPQTTAPTGVVLLKPHRFVREGGLLVGSFVTKALYYFPDIRVRPLPDPIEILKSDIGPVIDVAQNSQGEILVASGSAIYRLSLPLAGDADGDGRVDSDDLRAISREILDSDGPETLRAQEGTFRGSWGADANEDGVIDARDLVALAQKRHPRSRPVRP